MKRKKIQFVHCSRGSEFEACIYEEEKKGRKSLCVSILLSDCYSDSRKYKNNSTTHCGDYIKMPTRDRPQKPQEISIRSVPANTIISRGERFFGLFKVSSASSRARADMNNWGRTLAGRCRCWRFQATIQSLSLAPPKWMNIRYRVINIFSFLLSSRKSNIQILSIFQFLSTISLHFHVWRWAAGQEKEIENYCWMRRTSVVIVSVKLEGSEALEGVDLKCQSFECTAERERVHVQQRRDCGSEPSHGRECH